MAGRYFLMVLFLRSAVKTLRVCTMFRCACVCDFVILFPPSGGREGRSFPGLSLGRRCPAVPRSERHSPPHPTPPSRVRSAFPAPRAGWCQPVSAAESPSLPLRTHAQFPLSNHAEQARTKGPIVGGIYFLFPSEPFSCNFDVLQVWPSFTSNLQEFSVLGL